MGQLMLSDPGSPSVWWGTRIELCSAIARRQRAGELRAEESAQALAQAHALAAAWNEVLPSEPLRQAAERALRIHPLSAADSLQLAAALRLAEGHPGSIEFVCLDDRLADAAAREGFRIVKM